jgi:protein gp37
MADRTGIEWTNATWNPIAGCSLVSPGCTNCYAMAMAHRINQMTLSSHYEGLTKRSKGGKGPVVWTGKIASAPDRILTAPLRWKRPRLIFVNSMSDLFHESVPDEWLDRVFAVMAMAQRHTFQVLTKRSARMRAYCSDPSVRDRVIVQMGALSAVFAAIRWPLPNVWKGVSAEDQKRADERIPDLLATPAAVRFVSAEPLLAPIDFTWVAEPNEDNDGVIDALLGCNWVDGHGTGVSYKPCRPGHADRTMTREVVSIGTKIDWLIVGGESGPGARPMQPDWARSVRDQCQAADVPFFFKQWGEFLPVAQHLPGRGKIHGATAVKPGRMKLHYGGTPQRAPDHAFSERGVEFASTADGRLTFRVGKKAAGRLLDGVKHDTFPEATR